MLLLLPWIPNLPEIFSKPTIVLQIDCCWDVHVLRQNMLLSIIFKAVIPVIQSHCNEIHEGQICAVSFEVHPVLYQKNEIKCLLDI